MMFKLFLTGSAIRWRTIHFLPAVTAVFLFLLVSTAALAQENGKYKNLLVQSESKRGTDSPGISGPVDIAVYVLYACYKEVVSSQDYHRCSFTPSCSAYALEAVRKHGWLAGTLAAFDRLSRCHARASAENGTESSNGTITDLP